MLNLAFFIGAHGGDYRAICAAAEKGLVDISVSHVIAADDMPSPVMHPTTVMDFTGGRRQPAFEHCFKILDGLDVDYIFLAGFFYLLPATLVSAFEGRIINSHHSLLPAHPGLFRKERLVASDDKFLGATVHRVDAGIDTGEKLYQAVFPNTGMTQLDAILARYRMAQDMMIVQCVRDLASGEVPERPATVLQDILFNPGIDPDVIEGFHRG